MSESFRLLGVAIFWFAGIGLAHATPLVFSDAALRLRDQSGLAVTGARVKLGTFTAGFVPTASNRDQWAAHWFSTGIGFYAASDDAREWSAECIFPENANFPIGELFYVWVSNAAADALFTDPNWKATSAPPLGVAVHYDFTSQTTAVVGEIDPGEALASLAVPVLSIVTQPRSQTLVVGSPATFTVEVAGAAPLAYQWRKDGVDISGATEATLVLDHPGLAQAGAYTVVVSNSTGFVVSQPAQLAFVVEPTIAVSPESHVVVAGESVTFTVAATGTAPITYQWFKDGAPIAGATSDTYTLSPVTVADAGIYTVEITNAAGTVTSNGAVLTVNHAYLTNVAVRASMKQGQTLIIGFVVADGSEPILVRAGGPVVNQYGLNGLPDPMLKLVSLSGTVVATNDDWPTSLRELFSTLGAAPYENGSKDAALLWTVSGPQTAHTTGTGNGVVLVEAYDAGAVDATHGAKLVNVSARYQVGTGDDILIAGFVIAGTGKKQVLIRGVGPGLVKQGVTGVLADPQIVIYDQSTPIGRNDDWSSDLVATFNRLGAYPLDAGSKDAALVIELDAGKPYTVHVSGVGNTTGEALVEVYDANP